MEKKTRKELVGTVVNSTNNKTINVLVETYKCILFITRELKALKNIVFTMKRTLLMLEM